MSDGIILLSAGHGGGAAGAQGPEHNEAELTLDLRDRVIAALGAVKGFVVKSDGKKGENLSLSKAIVLAREADIAVEIHFNNDVPGASGAECFGTKDTAAFCRALSKACAQQMGDGVRGRDGGYKHHTDSFVGSLGFVRAGGVVLEVCFLNEDDMQVYLPKRDAIAGAIADVIRKHALGKRRSPEVREGWGRASLATTHPGPTRGRHLVAPGTQSRRHRTLGAPQRRTRLS